ncbi:MAG TPA: type II toxin-antitoxin system VapC family toxin [Stellaceae bacterium]|nr:type II toxin-antitoxin system VapC family toxin [Stellaceae bacterium]
MPIAKIIKVIDASALAAIVFGEPEAAAIHARFDGSRLAAPALLAFELANVCLVKMRRHPKQRASILGAFMAARNAAIETLAVDHAGVVELAETMGLTAYDASYLWLARHLGGELITLDGQLMKAAAALE